MQKKLVLFPFPGDSIGGSLISTVILARALKSSEQFEAKVILHAEGSVSDWLKSRGVDFEVLENCPTYNPSRSKLERISDLLKSRRSISAIVNKLRPCIVHTNDIRTHITWAIGVFGTTASHVWHQRTRWSGSFFVRILARQAACRFAISRYVQEELNTIVGVDSVYVRNPLPDQKLKIGRVQARSQLLGWNAQLCEERPLVCFVGALSYQKRPKDFIEIIARTNSTSGERIQWVMIGKDGDYKSEDLRDFAKHKGVDHSVIIQPFTDEINVWYEAMDILIATSEHEGLGRNILEAMSAETAVIASRSGGHPELIHHGKTGFLEELGDVEGFSKRVNFLISDHSKREEVGRSASLTVDEDFHPKRICEEVILVYNTLCT